MIFTVSPVEASFMFKTDDKADDSAKMRHTRRRRSNSIDTSPYKVSIGYSSWCGDVDSKEDGMG